MNGCEGCSNTDTNYKLTREEAKRYANETRKTVAITKNAKGEHEYFDAQYARTIAGIKVIEHISPDNTNPSAV